MMGRSDAGTQAEADDTPSRSAASAACSMLENPASSNFFCRRSAVVLPACCATIKAAISRGKHA